MLVTKWLLQSDSYNMLVTKLLVKKKFKLQTNFSHKKILVTKFFSDTKFKSQKNF